MITKRDAPSKHDALLVGIRMNSSILRTDGLHSPRKLSEVSTPKTAKSTSTD